MLLAGPSNRLNGGPGDDVLFAGSWNSILMGGPGRDQFWIINGELPHGVNYIRDFGRDQDTIVIDLDGVNSFSDLNLVRRGRNTIIYIGTISVAVIWRNLALNEDDFLFVGDNTGPTIRAELVNDTGVDDSDRITFDSTIEGTVTDSSEIISLTASLPSEDTVVEVKDNGSFTFVPGALEDGNHSVTLSAEDAAGNVTQVSVSFTLDTTAPTITASLAEDTGVEDDTITSEPTLTGTVIDISQILALRAGFGDTQDVDILGDISAQGSFSLSRERLEEINGGVLGDGDHSLTLFAEDAAGNLSQISVSFTLDTTAPTAIIASSLDTTSTVIEVSYSEAVSGLEVGNYTLTSGGEIVPVESVEEINSSLRQLNLGTRLNAGNYQLSITGVSDLAGNVLDDPVVLDFTVVGAPVEISPTSGSEMVSLNQNPVVRFGKKVDPTTVNENTFEIIANGEQVAGRIAVSSTREFATFFSDTALPASTSVRITVVGDEIMGLDGVALDADGDGTPGGTLTADFSTLSLIKIDGTNITCYVYDSFNRDAEGNNVPVVGATVRVDVDALPKVFAVTDSEGFFRLENVPAPLLAVHIDGSIATNAPAGTSYATVGKIFESVPGQEVQLNHHGSVFDIFLPTKETPKHLKTKQPM